MGDEQLVGAAEAAEILGVSRQQLHRLAHAPDFPAPVATLRAGKVWRRAAVEAWQVRHQNRRPGRPERRPEA